MAKGSYNSVGAGETPRLGVCKSVEVESRPGAGESFASVKVSTDIPRAGRPGGATFAPKAAGEAPKAARPGGSQGI